MSGATSSAGPCDQRHCDAQQHGARCFWDPPGRWTCNLQFVGLYFSRFFWCNPIFLVFCGVIPSFLGFFGCNPKFTIWGATIFCLVPFQVRSRQCLPAVGRQGRVRFSGGMRWGGGRFSYGRLVGDIED